MQSGSEEIETFERVIILLFYIFFEKNYSNRWSCIIAL